MLLDWLDRLFTPCPLHLREMGYKRELFGIRRRWRQFAHTWRPHCDRTRALLLRAARCCQRQRKAVLFGTGFLHDVPLVELAALFERVVLVDLLHPFSARRQARRFPNVALLEADVSDTVEAVWLAVERGSPLPSSKPRLFLDDAEVDFVASINLLSQLPCMPRSYLKRWKTHSADDLAAFCRGVVETHLDYLRVLPGVVALVADFESVTLTTTGEEVRRESTLDGVNLPEGGERWVWPLVPRGDRPPHHATHLIVAGIEDFKATPAAPAAAP